jgi:cytochrome c oxidase assembly factor CtaG
MASHSTDIWTWHTQFLPLLIDSVILIVSALWLHRRNVDELRKRRRAAFVIFGIALVGATSSGLFVRCTESETWHMIAHLVVTMVLAPLAVLTFAGTTNDGKRRLGHPLLRHPAIGFTGFTVLVPLSHLTPMNTYVMTHPPAMFGELLVYGLIGTIFWKEVIGRQRLQRLGHRIIYLGLGVPVSAMTGLVMTQQTQMAMGSIADLHSAGLVMVIGGSGIMALETALLVVIWLINERSRSFAIVHKA